MDKIERSAIASTSKYWSKLSELNAQLLEDHGLANFKRTVNNGYFNWMVTDPRADTFRFALRQWLRRPDLGALFTTIEPMNGVATAFSPIQPTFRRRHVYRQFVSFLWATMKRYDTRGLHKLIQEPEAGNPVRIRWGGQLISQDLAHSILECNKMLNFSPAKTIIEIGGGYGRLAHVAHALIPDCRYYIVDIEQTLKVSEYYLKAVIGADNVERLSPDREPSCSVVLLTPDLVHLLPSKKFDVALSISTLPELAPAQVTEYLEQMQRLSRGAIFLKQWDDWSNPLDDMNLAAKDYSLEKEWRLALDVEDPLIPHFFNKVWTVN